MAKAPNRSEARITRTVKPSEKPRGVKRGSKRGRYDTSRIKDPLAKPWLKPPVYQVFSEAPRHIQERAREKGRWVRRYVNDGRPRRKLPKYIAEYARAAGIPANKIPPYQTIYRWAVRLEVFGEVGLLDAPSASAGKPQVRRVEDEQNPGERIAVRSITPEQEELIIVGLFGGQLGYTDLLNFLADHSPPGSNLPSYEVVRAVALRAERENPHLAAIASQGLIAHRDLNQLSLSHGALPGGYCLAIDSTVADIWVRVSDATQRSGFAAKRPILTTVMDVGSRSLITFNLSLHPIDSGIIKGVFQRAIYQEGNYPGLLSTGLLPYELMLDKGAEHRAEFRELIDQLTIKVRPRMANNPKGGAHVETLTGTIATEVFKGLVGYAPTQEDFDPYAAPEADTKRSLRDRKYESYKAEWPVEFLLPIEELEAVICGWGVSYNERPHVGLPVESSEIRRVVAEHYRAPDALFTQEAA
jgi:transposase InsO family protein